MVEAPTILPPVQSDLFHFEESLLSFEDYGHQNGFRFWYARDLSMMMGYPVFKTFERALNKAMATCGTLNINVLENFQQVEREVDGEKVRDWKLSKFACYLVAMNGDTSKPYVARAQAYFATIAVAFQNYLQDSEDVERVLIRDELSDHEKSLSSTASAAGVQDYGYFQSAGYRGMYNMNLKALKQLKGIDAKRSPLDFMGKAELAANLFRLTQTEEKIRNEGINGQKPLERAASSVGRDVRDAMIKISGSAPEDLPVVADIKKVKTDLKATQRGLSKPGKHLPKK